MIKVIYYECESPVLASIPSPATLGIVDPKVTLLWMLASFLRDWPRH